MNALEKRAVAAISGIFVMRMAGLFMLLPVLAIYATGLSGSTPFLVGMAMGVYGLTQALFQITFGMASDRFSRKPVITIGLLIFALGGLVAALADSIGWLIVGRAIQGAGAISAATLALTADLTRETERTKAIAIIGVSIGATFMFSLMFAPLLQSIIGVTGLFWLSAVFAVVAIVILWGQLPNVNIREFNRTTSPLSKRFNLLLSNSQLLRLNFGVFFLHMLLTALFFALPMLLQTQSGLPLASHWKIYTPILLLSVLGMVPLIRMGSNSRQTTAVFNISVGLLLISTLALAWQNGLGSNTLPLLFIALWLFFVSFNTLEAMLPSTVSRLAAATEKGAALGMYSTFQFLGMFAGGLSAGGITSWWGGQGVYWLCAFIAAVWLVIVLTAPKFDLVDQGSANTI